MRFLVFISFFAGVSVSQALTGNYRLKYLHSEIKTLHLEETSKNQTTPHFDFTSITPPPLLDVLYLLHQPSGPTATLTGAGIETPRECGGNTEKLPSQKLRCEPYSVVPFNDENTGCEGTRLFGEVILFSLIDNVQYSRNELLLLNKETKPQCHAYLKSLDFYQALESHQIALSKDEMPDVVLLNHLYQAISISDASVEVLKGIYTGTYNTRYLHSQARTWEELEEGQKERQVEGTEFNAAFAPLFIRDLPEVLLFHDQDKNTLKLAGAGSDKIRKCKRNEERSSEEVSLFDCPVFKAKEEELGTGCTIEHQITNTIRLEKNKYPQLSRIEKRILLESENSHCDTYRTKIKEELTDKRAEAFFQALLENGGIDSVENLGNHFVLEHVFELRVPPSEY